MINYDNYVYFRNQQNFFGESDGHFPGFSWFKFELVIIQYILMTNSSIIFSHSASRTPILTSDFLE